MSSDDCYFLGHCDEAGGAYHRGHTNECCWCGMKNEHAKV